VIAIVVVAVMASFLVWLLFGRSAAPVLPDEDLSYEEKEAADELREAEEEVRDRESDAQPDEERPGDDWGPGTARSY
jgi:beta-lactam-binding protein with PASTA domain